MSALCISAHLTVNQKTRTASVSPDLHLGEGFFSICYLRSKAFGLSLCILHVHEPFTWTMATPRKFQAQEPPKAPARILRTKTL